MAAASICKSPTGAPPGFIVTCSRKSARDGARSARALWLGRAKALDARRLRHQGIDPIDARRATKAQGLLTEAKAITFGQCVETYIKAHRAGWRNLKHAAQWKATLATYAEPIIGMLPVQAIDTALVMTVLEQALQSKEGIEPLWTARPETA